MSSFGKNIKKIRGVKKLSQSDFGAIFNLTRASIGAYEEERAEPKIDTVIGIAKYFGISIESLVAKELTVNEIIHFDSLKKILRTTYLPPVKFVDVEKQKIYAENCTNGKWINDLPPFGIYNYENLRAFVASGSEMTILYGGIRNNDTVIAQKIKNLSPEMLQHNAVYVVITKQQIIIRRLHVDNEKLKLIADNPDYSPIEIDYNDIVECWQVKGVYSEKLSNWIDDIQTAYSI